MKKGFDLCSGAGLRYLQRNLSARRREDKEAEKRAFEDLEEYFLVPGDLHGIKAGQSTQGLSGHFTKPAKLGEAECLHNKTSGLVRSCHT